MRSRSLREKNGDSLQSRIPSYALCSVVGLKRWAEKVGLSRRLSAVKAKEEGGRRWNLVTQIQSTKFVVSARQAVSPHTEMCTNQKLFVVVYISLK